MNISFLKLSLFLIAGCFGLFSCTDESPAPDNTGTSPYAVTGTVVDTQGNPMAGVKVRADNDALYGSAEVITDANGKYTLPRLELGGWKIYAWKEMSYQGKTYHLRMGMPTAAEYNAFSPGEEGTVKNFKWQLSGPIPDRPRSPRSGSGYFGGTLLFTNLGPDAVQMPSGTIVTITLTPEAEATLLDGSAPEVIRKSFTIGAGEYNYWIHDIAQCEYRITAESSFSGTTKALQLSTNINSDFASAVERFYFPPSPGSSGDYENGLLSSNDHPFYLYQP